LIRHEQQGPADLTAAQFCRQAVQSSDIYVGVIGLRRGFEPDGVRSITEMEFDWAGDAGIPRMIWLSPDHLRMDAAPMEDSALLRRQQTFRDRVLQSVIVARTGFEAPAQLALEVENHLLAHFVAGTLAGPELGGSQRFLRDQLTGALEQAALSGQLDLNAAMVNPRAFDSALLLQQLGRRASVLEARARGNPKSAEALNPQIASTFRDMAVLASIEAPDAALPLYEKALNFAPDHVATRIGYGHWLRRLGCAGEAGAAYRTAGRQARKMGQRPLEAQAVHSHALLEGARGHRGGVSKR
jgi:hypothetical protein